MEFYETQYNEALINRNLYSSNTYSFYHRHQQNINLYFTQLEKKCLQKRIESFKKNEDKENEMVGEEKNIEQTMDEETRKRLYEIRKQGSFMISDNNDNSFYEISF
jgi:hypothetical protein